MFNVNGWEILVIAVIALLVLGPDRLPEFMARAGRILAQLRQAADEATSEIAREIKAVSEMAEAQMEEATRPGRPPRGGAGGDTADPPKSGPATPDEAAPLDPSAADLPTIAPPAAEPVAPDLPTIAPPAAELFPPLVDGAPSGDGAADGDEVADGQRTPDAPAVSDVQGAPNADAVSDVQGAPNAPAVSDVQGAPQSDEAAAADVSRPTSAAGETPPNGEGDGVG